MFHNNYIRGKVNKDFRSREMGRYVLDVNGEYSSTTARYFTVQELSFVHERRNDHSRVGKVLADVVNMANGLNRTLVIPPLKCTKRGVPFCNMCHFERIDCFKNVMKNLKYPYKESVFFTLELSFIDFLHEFKCSFCI